MGRRAILAVVVLGALIAAGQLWLLSAILSRPLPSGRTGWEVIAAEQAKRRSSNMPLVEGVSIAYKCGNAVYGSASGDDTIYLRLNGPSPGLSWCTVTVYFSAGENTIWIGETTGYGPFPEEVDCPLHFNAHGFDPVPSGQYELQWISAGTGSRPSGSTGLFLSIDTTTLPSFLGPYVGSDDCGPPVTVQVSTEIHHATSWSYQLYDSGGNPISGGSPGAGTHELDGCSGYAHVTDIPIPATRITFTATNGNGSSTVSSNLALPSPSVGISADPTGILEGQEATLSWSATYASVVHIDNGIGVVGHTPKPWIDNKLSGSVTVSPTETTTYTITANGFCQEATAQVTVTVSPPPTRHNLGPNPGEGTAWYLVPEPCD